MNKIEANFFGANSSCHLLSAYFKECPSWAQARQNHAACCIGVSSTRSCSTVCSKVSLLALNPCSCVHKQCKPTAVGSIHWSSSALATQWEVSHSTHTHTHTRCALLRIQQRNGHNRTLNYSLCQIDMFLSAQTGWEQGKQAKWRKKMSQREEGGGGGCGGKLPPF